MSNSFSRPAAGTMLSRRRFIASATALAGAVALPAARAQTKPTIDVKKLGAFGDGKLPDLRQLRRACEMAADHPAGATIYFPPGEYYMGAADASELLQITNLQNVRFVGERATISCRTVNGTPAMFVLAACRNITIEGLTFRDYGLKRENRSGAHAISFVNNGSARGPENTIIRDCRFESVLSGIVSDNEGNKPGGRTRGITLTNITVSRSYYGFNFADNGDDVTGRDLRCDDVHRSYFPYGVSNHDIELDTRNNASGFTDVLIKTYKRDTYGLRVKVKCRAKRSGDAIVALDNQHEKGQGTIRNVRLDLDIDDVNCTLNTAILIRSFDPRAHAETTTTNRWDDINIDGEIHICEKTKLIEIATVARNPGKLHIGPRLAKNPRLPRSFPGFDATIG
jgi:hypothetical protein